MSPHVTRLSGAMGALFLGVPMTSELLAFHAALLINRPSTGRTTCPVIGYHTAHLPRASTKRKREGFRAPVWVSAHHGHSHIGRD
jgi:hypothetical protein